MVDDIRTFADRGFPSVLPHSWYQIGWSAELEPGAMKSMRYFGEDLVAYRTESGELVVTEAYCQHLGAHLGVGGSIVGEEIQCPFHGWRWNAAGENTDIPYSAQKCVARKMRIWPTREHSGLMFIWYHPEGAAPLYEVPPIPEANSSEYYDPWPSAVQEWSGLAIHPQSPTENLVDPAHLKYVHGAGEIDMKLEWDSNGPQFTKLTHMHFGVGRESTILTPNGPTEGEGRAEAWGLGYFISRFDVDGDGKADMALVTATTPVDTTRSDMRQTVIARRDDPSLTEEWSKLALWWVKEERRQIERDMPIWEHMVQINRAPFPREESKAFIAIRRWASQFYEGGVPDPESDEDETNQLTSTNAN